MSDNTGTKQQKEHTPAAGQMTMEAAKKWLQLVAQARIDETLKQRLMDTPVVVLQEHGINVRQGLDIRVVENTDKVAYLTLPLAGSEELTDKELDGVTGGSLPGLVVAVGKAILGTITNVVGAADSLGVFKAAPNPLNNPK